MRLVFSGHHLNPPRSRTWAACPRPSYGDTNGVFQRNGMYEKDPSQELPTVWFNLRIQIVESL